MMSRKAPSAVCWVLLGPLTLVSAAELRAASFHILGTSSGPYEPSHSTVASDVSADARRRLTQATGVKATADNKAVLRFAETVVLAVKPQVLGEVLADLVDAGLAEVPDYFHHLALQPAQIVKRFLAHSISLRVSKRVF